MYIYFFACFTNHIDLAFPYAFNDLDKIVHKYLLPVTALLYELRKLYKASKSFLGSKRTLNDDKQAHMIHCDFECVLCKGTAK